MDKKINLIFLGNDGNLISEIGKFDFIKIIGVVADKVSAAQREFFGSAFLIGKRWGLKVITQEDFNKDYSQYIDNIFKGAEIVFCQGYRFRFKKTLLERKGVKFINFHQSLLPRYAGRHPLNWVLVNGETQTGITFHYISEDFDAGDIILQKRIKISEEDDVISLYRKTIRLASGCLREVFRLVYNSKYRPIKQDLRQRSYYHPRSPSDGAITDADTIEQIENKIRALKFPYPGASICFNDKIVVIDKVRRLRRLKGKKGMIIRAKDGFLEIIEARA